MTKMMKRFIGEAIATFAFGMTSCEVLQEVRLMEPKIILAESKVIHFERVMNEGWNS